MTTAPPRWISELIAARLVRDGKFGWIATDGASPPPWLRATTMAVPWVTPSPAHYISGSHLIGWHEVRSAPLTGQMTGPGLAVVQGTESLLPPHLAAAGIAPSLVLSTTDMPAGPIADQVLLGSGGWPPDREITAQAQLCLETLIRNPVELGEQLHRLTAFVPGVSALRCAADQVLLVALNPLICLDVSKTLASRHHLSRGHIDGSTAPVHLEIPSFGGDSGQIRIRFSGAKPAISVDGRTPAITEPCDTQTISTGLPASHGRQISIGERGPWRIESVRVALPFPDLGPVYPEFPGPLDIFDKDPFRAEDLG